MKTLLLFILIAAGVQRNANASVCSDMSAPSSWNEDYRESLKESISGLPDC